VLGHCVIRVAFVALGGFDIVIVSSSHHSSSVSSPSKGESKGLVFVAMEGVSTFGWLGCAAVVLVDIDIVKWRV
jgi:hypothetical protein